jgi:hypothetical protein
MQSYDDAYRECIKRIEACPLVYVDCVLCEHCISYTGRKNPGRCPNKVQIYKINDECLKPVQIYEEAINQRLLLATKKALQKNLEKGTKVPLEYLFMTVNPKPSISFEQFKGKIFKILKTSLFSQHIAVFEQRGTLEQGDVGRGFHAHILFKRHLPLDKGLPPSNLKQKFKQSLQRYCDVKNNSCLNLQFVGEDFAYDKLQYITGSKTDDGKDLKQVADVVWRKQNYLEKFYGTLTL